MDNSASELAIRSLVARYCDAVNRYDAKAWASTWAEDGTWLFLAQEHQGREAIAAFWSSVVATSNTSRLSRIARFTT